MPVNDYGIEVLKKAAEEITTGDKSNYLIKTSSLINDIKWVSGSGGIDSATNTLQVIDYEHHEIHAGSHYYVCGFESLAENANIDFIVATPNTAKWLHMTFEIAGQSRTEFYIYEGAAYTGGTEAIPMNNDRNSIKTSDAKLYKGSTISNVGTLIFSQSKGREGTKPQQADSQGITQRNREIILKQNTNYLFRITSKDAANIIAYCGEWYEHTNKN